jgi:uncharacterized protein (TIGR00725 family)
MKRYVAIVGPGAEATAEHIADARLAAQTLAGEGIVIVTGGLGGVMGAAAQGARAANGVSVGLLPGTDRERADPDLTVAIPTGMGELRNGLVVRAADAVLAIGRSAGTLSEIGFAARTGVPVVMVDGWNLSDDSMIVASSIGEAIALVLATVSGRT